MEKHFMLVSLTFSTLLLAQPAGAVPPGEFDDVFDLGPRPHEQADPSCGTHLMLASYYYPVAMLAESVSGCEQPVPRNPRTYRLHLQSTDECNSRTYTGDIMWPPPDEPPYPLPRSLVLIDHREHSCNDLPARVIVEETVDGVTTTLYALDPVPITVTGRLETMYAICGESTGFGIVTEDQGTFELNFHGSQQEQFAEGRVARVMGGRTLLQGYCTQDRPAIDVADMLVCPSTEYVDCMPPAPEPKLCTPDAQEWVTANCPGVSYTF